MLIFWVVWFGYFDLLMEEKYVEENGKILIGKLDLICIVIINLKGCDEF